MSINLVSGHDARNGSILNWKAGPQLPATPSVTARMRTFISVVEGMWFPAAQLFTFMWHARVALAGAKPSLLLCRRWRTKLYPPLGL